MVSGQTRKIRWGVLGVARIATEKVIPATQLGAASEVVAIASRDAGKARAAAARLGIPRAYGSYEELLADPDVDAVYNPLPNHLHVPWSIRAAEAGKHVLCEKPIGMNAEDAARLIAVRDRAGVKMQEAFMVHTHPQWTTAVDLIRGGRIGEVRSIAGAFSFLLTDPANVRAVAEYGGGGLWDLGCYLVHTARWIFGREPRRVVAALELDARTRVDRLASMILEFGPGGVAPAGPAHAIGTCSMYQAPYQRIHVFGTSGRVEIEIPFNAPLGGATHLFVGDGSDPTGVQAETLEIAPCNQYTIQADRFSRAILDDAAVALPLEDSVKNMRVLDALVRSAASGRWEEM
jgi:predicted dehydrogenase